MGIPKAGRRLILLLFTAIIFFTMPGILVQAEALTPDDVTRQQTRAGEMPKNPVHQCTRQDDGTDTTDWDYVYFGSYPQTEVIGSKLTTEITGASYDSNGDAWVGGTKYRRVSKADTNSDEFFGSREYRYFKWERIKWKVLQNDGNTLFVVADTGLDCKNYNEIFKSVTWEDCTLREWLNNDFYSMAFSISEQAAIVEQTIANVDNPYSGTKGGNDTADNIFLLSLEEVTYQEYGFCRIYSTVSASRSIQVSDYAYAMGAQITTDGIFKGSCWWWLRSPGNAGTRAALVLSGNYGNGNGMNVNFNGNACVPALHIDLSSDLWSMTDDGSNGGGGDSGNTGDIVGDKDCSHQVTEVRNKKDATCKSDGYSGDTYCKDCNAKLRTGQEIAATGEHTWDEGKEMKAPTCTKKGEKVYICTVCSETKKEGLEKIPHTYQTVVRKATTAENGSITERCAVCGDVKDSRIIPSVKSAVLKTTSYTYNGRAKKPSVMVKDSNGKAVAGQNYTVSYKNNREVGKATVTIELKGNYTGRIKKTFVIVPKGTAISGKITAKSKGITVRWKKQAQSTTGYQIQVSADKKFAKKTTVTKTVVKNATTKLNIKKLKPKKKYYVRIRTYKTVQGKKYSSDWSKIKTVVTKK